MNEAQQQVITQLCDKGILVTDDVLSLIKKGMSPDTILQQYSKKQTFTPAEVSIVNSYKDNLKEITVTDFVQHYQVRLQQLTSLLAGRSELENLTSINRLTRQGERQKASVIGYVQHKQETKNGHLLLTIEDRTGKLRVLVINKEEKKDLFEFAKNLVLDDVVGICGTMSQGGDPVLFADSILLPDVPNGQEYKKCPDDVNALFIGDIHIGAKVFLEKQFLSFIDWLNGQDPEAQKVKYLFIVGDIIEGVGVYPNQHKDLAILPFREQYAYAGALLARIRKDVTIILCPGNHDVMRLSEPQPPIYRSIAPDIVSLPNLVNVSSPSLINIHRTAEFAGFDVLLYHGYSFFYYINNVEQIRKAGGIERIDLVMEFLLKRRHLAPTHTSTLYLPDADKDALLIQTIPDFFVTGHIHKHLIKKYKSVTLLNCSCFVDITEYQKKQGMIPDLCKVTCINLKTRNAKVLDFL